MDMFARGGVVVNAISLAELQCLLTQSVLYDACFLLRAPQCVGLEKGIVLEVFQFPGISIKSHSQHKWINKAPYLWVPSL